MSGRRPDRIAEQIREEVSLIVSGDLQDPRVGFVTVTHASVSPDLRHARIFVSVMGDDNQISESLSALNHASGYIRRQLGPVMRMRRIPELHFVFDQAARNAARIEELLSEEVFPVGETGPGDVEKVREGEQDQQLDARPHSPSH